MSGVVSTGSYPKALWEGVKSWWDSAAASTPEFAGMMFNKETSTKNYEEYAQSVGLGLAVVKPEGLPISYDAMQQGFVTRGTNVAYGLGIITTYEELKDNLYVKLTKGRVERLRRAFAETKNINATNIYNRAFDANYKGGDGVSLLNVAHPNFSAGTWQNKLAVDAALSQAALEDMLILMMQAKDDRGYIEPLMANKLVVHPKNIFVAKRILGTSLQTGSNNNDINPINNENMVKGGIVSNPYLTATGPWFLTTNCQDGMIWQEREALSTWEDNDGDTRNFKVGAYERYTFLWANARGLYGSNAA
ncbi:MAG: Mu-like prophage major head subunit gpT family protein [Burkholderiaceae bacterium]|nr:Mu-like prophage major head subunit gpT family protein [Burkholderiaceae bacterium]